MAEDNNALYRRKWRKDWGYEDFSGDPDQRENIARVSSTIAPTILDFFDIKGIGATFHVDELRRHVAAKHPTAPDSAGRIMRIMREKGVLNYEVINRRDSLYQICAVAETADPRYDGTRGTD